MKKRLQHSCFLMNFAKCWRIPSFDRTLPGDCSWIVFHNGYFYLSELVLMEKNYQRIKWKLKAYKQTKIKRNKEKPYWNEKNLSTCYSVMTHTVIILVTAINNGEFINYFQAKLLKVCNVNLNLLANRFYIIHGLVMFLLLSLSYKWAYGLQQIWFIFISKGVIFWKTFMM